jgi:HlyD family secretion protein
MKKLMVWIVVLAALGGGGYAGWYYGLRSPEAATQYRLSRVERGDLRVTVNATGTVQPFLLVQVGTQVTGTIQKLMVDFNSRVKADEVVAQIDPAPYQTRLEQDKANLARAEADVGRVKANLVQAEKELARSRELQKRELISASDLDAAVATYDSLLAQVKVAEASVAQARAAMENSNVNLRYTTIKSPIDGIVISRNVDVGQTVAASLSAPTIYVIADEMKRVQIQASVAEADIGRIKVDQGVTFNVDAYRTDRFKGKVSQIRMSPTTVQNVVTYTVMIDADNPDRKLLPGMTATVTFEIGHYPDVVRVPNSALRFTPPSEAAVAAGPAAGTGAGGGGGGGRGGGRPDRGERGERSSQGRVWINGPSGPAAVPITTGATDGAWTQVVQGDLKEGQEVIVGLIQNGSGGGMTNPFAPPRFGPPGGGGGPRR